MTSDPPLPGPPARSGAETPSPEPEVRADAPRRRELKVIRRGTMREAFEASVEKALYAHLSRLPAGTASRILRDAFEDFTRRVRENVRSVRGVTKRDFLAQLERSHDRILVEREKAREELAKLQEQVETFRDVDDSSPGLTRSERSRSLAAYESQIDVFQRRIAKLTESLARSERALEDLSRQKSVDPGIASVYRTVQGLSADDDQWELKHELLVRIFEANVALRDTAATDPAP